MSILITLYVSKGVVSGMTYIFKATVEDLELLLGEIRLRLQLIESFRPMTHHGHLQLIVHFI